MTTQKTKSELCLEEGWGGDLTNELVGKILCLASEIGEQMYQTALEFITYCPSEDGIQAFIEELEDIINAE